MIGSYLRVYTCELYQVVVVCVVFYGSLMAGVTRASCVRFVIVLICVTVELSILCMSVIYMPCVLGCDICLLCVRVLVLVCAGFFLKID